MKKNFSIVGLLLFAMAILFGASADISMAMADTMLTDPANQAPSASETPGVVTDTTGAPASATGVNASDIAAREIDKQIASIKPWQFTGTTDMYNLANRVTVTKYEIEHPITSSTPMDCTLLATPTYSSGELTLVAGTDITKENLKMFAPDSTVIVRGYDGYARIEDAVHPVAKGLLSFTVTDRSSTTVKLTPINGVWNPSDQLYNTLPTTIVGGTMLTVSAPACSESQLEVAPENYIPTTRKVYLQKKICNIVMTDDFKKQIKEIPFLEKDLRDNALYNFRRKNERTLWVGAPSKSLKFISNKMGSEDVYTSEGILPQILNKFAISGDNITFADLIDICRIQFGKNSVRDEAEAYCGMGFMSRLMKIDFEKTGDVTLIAQRDTYGIMVSKFQCSFGTLNFKKTPALDDLGYTDCCAILDMKDATRYVKLDNKTLNVDMKKSGADGEVREASRDIIVEIDALCLRGYNSMFVGPADIIFNFPSVRPNIDGISKFTATMAANNKTLNPSASDEDSVFYGGTIALPKDGDLWYLEADETFSEFRKGTLIEYKVTSDGGRWDKYSGSITV